MRSARRSSGVSSMGALLVLGSLLVLGLLIGALMLLRGGSGSRADGAITLYCAAGIKKPIKATIDQYAEEYGIAVDVQYGGSGTLLSSIEVSGKGDLYLAADDSYIKLAREKGLVA